jgi:soluble lytic murein transglycosylase
MQKKAVALGLAAVSVAAVAAGVTPPSRIRIAPLAVQSALLPPVMTQGQPTQQQPSYQPASYGIGSAIARWHSLRQSDSNSFSTYASFLTRYRNWPGEAGLRRSAERSIEASGAAPGEVIAYFRQLPPLTATGHARYAFALLASGQVEEARAAARRAWHAGVLPRTDEDRLIGAFGGALTQADHDRRMDTLLDNGDATSARRTLPWASAQRRGIYEARIALQTRAADASTRVANLGSAAGADAGLLADRADWLRNSGQGLAARALLAQSRRLTSRPYDAEDFMETQLTVARAAAADRQWTMAWQIASQIDDLFPAGTDLTTRTVGERDEYTSLAWLAGTTALHQLGRPADAIGMFERYGRAAQSLQTRSKGFYWAGRAAAATGQAERANAFFEQAAHPDLFYGQLALERLGREVPAPAPRPTLLPNDPAVAAFERRDLVEATKYLGQQGRWEDQSLFVRALSEALQSDQERALAGNFAARIGRPDLGVWVARSSRNAGSRVYTRASFPEIRVPPSQSRYWSLSNAITRQESSFDRAAISPAGARGLMQLMPGTAREQSGKLGMPYDFARLTRDPEYNIMLGSSYFARLMEQWGGSAPLAVASYNAGAGNVRKWINANGDPRLAGGDVLKWIEEIPFSETRNYVQRVLENAVVYDQLDPNGGAFARRNRLSYYLGKSSRPG